MRRVTYSSGGTRSMPPSVSVRRLVSFASFVGMMRITDAARDGGEALHLQDRLEDLVRLVGRDLGRRDDGHLALDALVHDEVLAGDLAHELDQDAEVDVLEVHGDVVLAVGLDDPRARRARQASPARRSAAAAASSCARAGAGAIAVPATARQDDAKSRYGRGENPSLVRTRHRPPRTPAQRIS